MNAKINDGGPAFPHQDWDPSIQAQRREHGMSLRDEFAGRALTGLLANSETRGVNSHYAKVAYAIADDMLKAREEEQQ